VRLRLRRLKSSCTIEWLNPLAKVNANVIVKVKVNFGVELQQGHIRHAMNTFLGNGIDGTDGIIVGMLGRLESRREIPRTLCGK
jgi:tetrahydromethanopterin S-methyltransferase subunit A